MFLVQIDGEETPPFILKAFSDMLSYTLIMYEIQECPDIAQRRIVLLLQGGKPFGEINGKK